MNYNSLTCNLIQILDGKTAFDFKDQRLFFRHFEIRDQNSIGNSYEKYKNIAIKKGIEIEEEIFARLKNEKSWNQDDELKIQELKLYITNLKKTKDNLFLPSQKEEHQKLIDTEQSQLNFLLHKRNELVGISAESFASKMANEEFLRTLIYEDEFLNKLKFTDREFGELNSTEISDLSNIYYKISSDFSDLNIQILVLQDFFGIYLSFCENTCDFFGKPISKLTAYQIKLLTYAKIFNNIFQYHDDIPEQIRKDPEAIFNFVDSKKNRDKYQSMQKDSGASVIFGAKDSDLDIIDPNAKKVSLAEEIKKNGGSLNMEQMMKLMGQ